MTQTNDILIIGGGVIGVCTAYYLAQQGRSVTLIEKDDICAGSSHGNAGWVAVGHAIPVPAPGVLTQGLKWLFDAASPFYIKPRLHLDLLRWLWQFQAACNATRMRRSIPLLLTLGQASLHLYDTLVATENLDVGYEHQGLLHLYSDDTTFAKAHEETLILKEFGVLTTVLDGGGVRQMEPKVTSTVTHGIYYPDYAHLVPGDFVRRMGAIVKERGVHIHTQTEVLGFETARNTITTVRTTRGNFAAEQVVLAAGAWTAPLLRYVDIHLSMQPAKGYSLTFKRTSACPSRPLFLDKYKVAVTPMGNLFRMSSTLELAGFDDAINQRRLAVTRRAIGEYVPGLEALELLEIWRGYRPATPDGLPIIGRTSQFTNLILATGHGMLGLTHGPVTGKLVAQLSAGETPDIDLSPFNTARLTR